jgi:MscS family membrane protein
LFKNYATAYDVIEFEKLLISPLAWLLSSFVLFFLFQLFNFPTRYKIKLLGVYELPFVLKTCWWVFFTLLVIWFLLRLTDFLTYLFYKRTSKNDTQQDEQILFFAKDLTKVIIGIVGVLFILGSVLHLDIRSLLGAAGIATLAIALAAKETLENLIASIIIFIEQPFTVGDNIKISDAEGTVEKIGFRSTVIRTNDKTLQFIPNKKMVDSVTENQTQRTIRRVKQRIEIYPNKQVNDIIIVLQLIEKNIKANTPNIASVSVVFADIQKGTLHIDIEYTVDASADALKTVKQANNIMILETLAQYKLDLAKPE